MSIEPWAAAFQLMVADTRSDETDSVISGRFSGWEIVAMVASEKKRRRSG